jgi:NitT/TauT family transport system substrate-binding protein
MAPRKLSLFAPAMVLSLIATPSIAEPFKLKIACTATSDCATAMVARDQDIFAKHGLDADVTLIGINTNIPPAIVSDSIQIGGPTSPVFLQAVDGGLDLVAVAGASVMDPEESKTIAAVARSGVSIKEPKDFVGKKVGRLAPARFSTCFSANG